MSSYKLSCLTPKDTGCCSLCIKLSICCSILYKYFKVDLVDLADLAKISAKIMDMLFFFHHVLFLNNINRSPENRLDYHQK